MWTILRLHECSIFFQYSFSILRFSHSYRHLAVATTQGKIIWAILLSTGTPETGRYFWPLIQPPLVLCCPKPWQKNRQQVNPDRSRCCWVLMRVKPFCLFNCARGRNPPTSASQGCSHLYKTPYTKKETRIFLFTSLHRYLAYLGLRGMGLHCSGKLEMKDKN